MRERLGKWKLWCLLFMLMFVTAGSVSYLSTNEVQAATAGFRTVNGKRYYINADGKRQRGWLILNGKKYYFNKKTGVQVTGWVKVNDKYYRYFTKGQGYMVTGWIQDTAGNRRYFNPSNGYMLTKWQDIGGSTYYFKPKTGIASKGFVENSRGEIRYFTATGKLLRGWITSTKGVTRYFATSSTRSKDGIMATGFKTIDGKRYYFAKSGVPGKLAKGWVKNKTKGVSYYFDKETGVMATGKVEIDGVYYRFSDTGICLGEVNGNEPNPEISTGSKTIKNYLAGALIPVGKVLYVWGGGWNDSTRKGLSSDMVAWYNKWLSNPSAYNYNDYRNLSAANRAKGFDCSGFVGWTAYQVMQKSSNVGGGYTVVSGEIGSYYSGKGWGTIINQSALSQSGWTLKPGDIGYNDGHTWIVLGQCDDKSVVIVHSTPQAGVQISGTTTPSGSYSSEAVALAKKYMSRYSGFSSFSYHTSSGNYIRNGNYLRWNSKTLSDPDGYANMTADEILYDLFGY